jgi:rSAM/selenodomain-associated transferase 2
MNGLQACMESLLPGLTAGLVREVILVDGGSTDATRDLGADMGCTVLALGSEQKGRGRQLAAGALAAKGRWLLFLHADTCLETGWERVVGDHLETKPTQAACFALQFDEDSAPARRVAALANLRTRVLGLPYGDQGLLIPRSLYDIVGGYEPLPLMEDVNLVRKLGKSRIVLLSATAVSSAARYRAGGWWAVPLRNLGLLIGYLLGADPTRLKARYK